MSDLLKDKNRRRSDVRMVRRAFRSRWKINPEMFKDMPGILDEIARDVKEKTPTRIAAIQTLVAMDKVNSDKVLNAADAQAMLIELDNSDGDDAPEIQGDAGFFGNDAHEAAQRTIQARLPRDGEASRDPLPAAAAASSPDPS